MESQPLVSPARVMLRKKYLSALRLCRQRAGSPSQLRGIYVLISRLLLSERLQRVFKLQMCFWFASLNMA